MIRILSAAILLATSLTVNAMDRNPMMPVIGVFTEAYQLENIDWQIGDTAKYNIDMGFIKGKMHSFVREKTDRGFWIQQDMDMGPFGKQKVEIHIDGSTGQTIEIRVNGQRQDPPNQGGQEVVETREEKVNVPAGAFDTLYLKIKNTNDGKMTEAWINGEVVPLGGMVKTIAPGQMGKVKVELTAYEKK